MSTLRSALCALLIVAGGCNRPASQAAAPTPPSPPGRAEAKSGPPSPAGGVVDSILPLEEQIRHFRETVGDLPERLEGGATTRDALVQSWVTAVEFSDTLALARMLLNAGEFIAFYYPESPYTRPPYRQAPGVRWMLIQNTNDQGITRVLRRHGGRSLEFRGYACATEPQLLGRNRIWNDCVVRFVEDGREVERRLFGPILERDGRFKFLTYASDY